MSGGAALGRAGADRRRLLIRVRGVVQGVGFRPFVKRAADERGIIGSIRNDCDGVLIDAEGGAEALGSFLDALNTKNPPGSLINSIIIDEPTPRKQASGGTFIILESLGSGPLRASLPPDSAPCPACLREIFDDPAERRHRYPFTNCTHCGPRFTIAVALPYDRERTTLREFPLCDDCAREHRDPGDRRFHAQPIACPACGPNIFGIVISPCGETINTTSESINTIGNALLEGSVCALKGVGGYQLLADATSSAAVSRLRARKRRPDKPFAVMFPSLASLREVADISPAEEDFLSSPAAPILLVRRKASHAPGLLAPEIAPNSPYIGAMLPSSPLHHILLRALLRPLVCTSGNLSNEPICTTEPDAVERLGEIADLFLAHNRPIARPVDDSVARAGPTGLEILRRARGFCPLPLAIPGGGRKTALALGGHLKSTVALYASGEITVSQHLGDLESPLAVELHKKTAEELLQFFNRRPEIIACDLHPDYASTRLAERLAERFGAELVPVQHHHAHIAAVMAEHGIDGPVLGFAWDGIGYGDNGDLWGGEALVCDGAGARRVATLRPFPLPGGEAAVREGRRAAAGLLYEARGAAGLDIARTWFSKEELPILARMLERSIHSPRTTSIGRLFDAMAAIAGGRLRSTFEGQAAMEFEFASLDVPDEPPYPLPLREGPVLEADWEPLLYALLDDRDAPIGLKSARFHAALAELAVAIATRIGIQTVAIAGGCFQNLRLATQIRRALSSRGFTVYAPAKYPPNDGALALGQAYIAARRHLERKDPSDVSWNPG